MVLTRGRTIYAKPEASCQARYTCCHLQPLLYPHSSKKDPQFRVFIYHCLTSQTRAFLTVTNPLLSSHTNTSQGDSNCSHILLQKKLPCLTNPAAFCLSPAWHSWSQPWGLGNVGWCTHCWVHSSNYSLIEKKISTDQQKPSVWICSPHGSEKCLLQAELTAAIIVCHFQLTLYHNLGMSVLDNRHKYV